jgi:phosphoribosylamine--glycine ligase
MGSSEDPARICPVKVLVFGSGGREHALAWRLRQDPDVRGVVCAPGNPGMTALGPCVPVDLADAPSMLAVAEREGVDLTVVGPEAALEAGVADLFVARGRPIVGPPKRAAQLESSKAFAKAFMQRHGIPTARFVVCDDLSSALTAVAGDRFGFPVVVKADGLAAGKGVVIAQDRSAAEGAVRAAMEARQFGEAGRRLVIEECLAGPEVSFFALADGRRAIALGTAQDHKRIFDGDRGPNTGGMGAFAPSPLLDARLSAQVMSEIVQKVIAAMAREESPYHGFLYVSLMLTPAGPRVIEFNVRFGDPEAQVVLPLLDGSFGSLLLAAAQGALTGSELPAPSRCAVGVVMASAGYPASADSGRVIDGLEAAAAQEGILVFHAGTRRQNGQLVTAGGRVLTVVGQGPTFERAMDRAYAAVRLIRFEGMQYRRDIGAKAIHVDAN